MSCRGKIIKKVRLMHRDLDLEIIIYELACALNKEMHYKLQSSGTATQFLFTTILSIHGRGYRN